MLIYSLKSTNDCIDLAKTLTIERSEELIECGKKYAASSKKWLELECFDIASIMATKLQFCNETIYWSEQFAKGKSYV